MVILRNGDKGMKYKPEKIDAVLAIKNDAIVSQKADGSIVFVDGNPTDITDKQIEDKLVELNEEFTNTKYQRSRASEYPSIPDQLDEIYHNGVDSWKAIIKQTKDKYPKG